MAMNIQLLLSWSLLLAYHLLLPCCRADTENVRSCEPIKLELCRGIGYSQTSMPNLIGHDLQKDAQLQLQTFTPLIQYGCSSQLQFFLCSVYVPMCTEKVATPIGPCRPLCESVRSRCQPVLQEFGFPWPTALNCSKFPPENNQHHMCMDGPEEENSSSFVAPPSSHLNGIRPLNPGQSVVNIPQRGKSKTTGVVVTNSPGKNLVSPGLTSHPGPCDRYRHSDRFVYINRTGRCAQLCEAHLAFSSEDKTFAGIWMAVWAAVCFIATLFTALTFLIDGARFRYPERPIIFLAFCCNIYSVGFGVRLIAGRKDVACFSEPEHGHEILIQEGLDHTNCAIVFLLLYFFGMAASVWWVLLTMTWYMAAGRQWTHDVIQRWSSYLHLAAWGLPAAQTIAILVLMAVDADELTGMCYVGNQSPNFLLSFVIVPHLVYLLVGLCFMAAGFAAMCKSRQQQQHHQHSLHHLHQHQQQQQQHHHHHHQQQQQQQHHQHQQPLSLPGGYMNTAAGHLQQQHSARSLNSSKNETLLIRVGIFSSIYLVPSICVLASHCYEYAHRNSWILAGSNSRPTIEVFMLKIFMSLVVGITCALWVWSAKTINAWKKLGRRLLHRKQAPPPFLPSVHLKQQHVLLLDKHKRVKCGSKSGSETAV